MRSALSTCSYLALAVTLLWTPNLRGQAAAGAASLGAPTAAAAGGAAGQAPNLWTFLCPPCVNKMVHNPDFCNTPLGKICSAVKQPMTTFSGGLIQDDCAKPTLDDLNQPAESAGGAAARVKADTAAAKQRAADVRYLATVDCGRWPEAELALINALRGDRNECVRFAAAQALNRSCCCTPKTVEALSIVVAGSNRDGFPVERSERVRAMAAAALHRCLACLRPHVPLLPVPQPAPQDEPERDVPPESNPDRLPPQEQLPVPRSQQTTGSNQVGYYKHVDQQPIQPLFNQARQTVQQNRVLTAQYETPRSGRTNGLVAIVRNAFSSPPQAAYPQTPPPPQPMPQTHLPSPAPAPMPASVRRGVLPSLRQYFGGRR